MALMAQVKMQLLPILVLVLLAMVEATPPGIANHPSQASCKIKKYKHCYNLVHVCPKFCPNGECTVECASCKPICSSGSTPPSVPDSPPNDGNNDNNGGNNNNDNPTPSPPNEDTPSPPTTNTPPSPATSPPSIPPPSTPSPPTTSTPPPSTPPQSPPTESLNPPPSPPSTPTPTPPTTSTPPPSTPTPSPPRASQNPPPSPPSPSTQSGNPPPSPGPTHSPPQSQNSPPSTKTVTCKNKYYPQCYNLQHTCPNSCPGGCEVDCVTCKPVCNCDRPGAVCQDPRFIGGDGITFYFHGKKDQDFCLVSDSNLHINAHFVGRRNENMKRDFTWVQSIAIFFDKHQLFIGALKTSTWDDSTDRLSLTFDGESVTLSESEGAKWQSAHVPNVTITRASDTNNVMVEVEGNFKITAKVVPITEEDSRIHNYGITKEDCFAHLDLGFKFYSLSDDVNGVLGQTYRPGYVSPLNIGAKMPVMGGDIDFHSSSLFAPDCAVSRFTGSDAYDSLMTSEMPELSCGSGIDGRGVVCKR